MTSLRTLLFQRIIIYAEIIEQLPLDKTKKVQLNSVFLNYVRICESLAKKQAILNDLTNVIVIVLSAIVPVVIHLTPDSDKNVEMRYLESATILSVILAVLNALRQSYKYRERWQNYRQTAEILILEGQAYFGLSGKYSGYTSHDSAFAFFIESVNGIRAQQIRAYASQLLAINDKEVVQSIAEEIKARSVEIADKKKDLHRRRLINNELDSFVTTDQRISYYLADHDAKQVTLYLNNQTYSPPEKFRFLSSDLLGLVYKVNVESGDAKIHSDVSPSSLIRNSNMPRQGFGSVGCICERSDRSKVLVTCYHVVKHSTHNWDMFLPGANEGVVNSDLEYIGDIVEGERTNELDIALVTLPDGQGFDQLLPNGQKILDPIYIDEENYQDFNRVFIISSKRNFKKIEGRLTAVNKPITINYGSTTSRDDRTITNLMIITYVSTEPFSKPGDSGSLAFAEDGTAIGIVVGGDGRTASFLIPFTTVRDRYNLKLI